MLIFKHACAETNIDNLWINATRKQLQKHNIAPEQATKIATEYRQDLEKILTEVEDAPNINSARHMAHYWIQKQIKAIGPKSELYATQP